jgi:Cys-tRNA(Pro) deacylase
MSVKYPVTAAVRVLRQHGVAFEPLLYTYEARGGTRVSSRELGVPEHAVIKTLIFEDERKQPLCVLMHGDREVSAKNLARQLDKKSVGPCAPEVADRHSGYQVGGTSPFGLKRALPVYVERSILELSRIYINGGARGFLVALEPRVLENVLHAVPVDVAIER